MNGYTSSANSMLPPAASRLARAMVEEANFNPDTLKKAVSIIALFAHGCQTNESWSTLMRGPYGPDLREAALRLFMEEIYFDRVAARDTVALMEVLNRPDAFWLEKSCEAYVIGRCSIDDKYSVARALLTIAGSFWRSREDSYFVQSLSIYEFIEKQLSHPNERVQIAAAWAWGFWRHLQPYIGRERPCPQRHVVAGAIKKFVEQSEVSTSFASFVLSDLVHVPSGYCELELTADQSEFLHRQLEKRQTKNKFNDIDDTLAIARTALIIRGFCSREKVISFVENNPFPDYIDDRADDLLIALGMPVPNRRSRNTLRGRSKEKINVVP